MKKFLLFFAALTAAGALSAHAQSITVTTNTTWNSLTNDPLTRVFTSTTSQQNGGVITNSNAAMQQTFTATDAFSAQEFHIRYRQGGSFNLSIFEVANANQANPLTLGAQLFTASVDLPVTPTTTNTVTGIFTLATPLALSNGAYAFQLSPLLDSIIEWRRTTTSNAVGGVFPGDTYADGRAYIVPSEGFNNNFNAGSSEFALAVVAVPEPTTISLVLASLGALYLGMRRRR